MPKLSADLILGAKLKRVVLNSISFEMLIQGNADGTATIENSFEVGVKSPISDEFFVAITITVSAVEPNSNRNLYAAKAKMTGYYALEKAVEDNRAQELSDCAVERARFQLYPLVRQEISILLSKGGVMLKSFPFEIPHPDEHPPHELEKRTDTQNKAQEKSKRRIKVKTG